MFLAAEYAAGIQLGQMYQREELDHICRLHLSIEYRLLLTFFNVNPFFLFDLSSFVEHIG